MFGLCLIIRFVMMVRCICIFGLGVWRCCIVWLSVLFC